jgi:hypothetical protein
MKQYFQEVIRQIMHLPTNKISLITALSCAVATFSVTANAGEGLSYSYLELDYINLNIDEVGDSGSVLDDLDNGGGWGVRGAFELSPNWFAFGQYSVTEADANFVDDQNLLFRSNTDINRLDVGAGFHTPMNNKTDLVLRVAYTDIDTDGFNFGGTSSSSFDDLNEDSSDGYFIDAALRSQLLAKVEGSLGVRYTDLEQIDNVSVIGNLLYEFSPTLGLNLGLEAGDNISHFLIGLRLSF